MLFWNKVEIYCGFSLKEFSELRNSLASAGIRYDYKIIPNRSMRARFNSLGQNPQYDNQYYLYVHQKDYYNAMHLTSNRHKL
jgi:hypothetical protein